MPINPMICQHCHGTKKIAVFLRSIGEWCEFDCRSCPPEVNDDAERQSNDFVCVAVGDGWNLERVARSP